MTHAGWDASSPSECFAPALAAMPGPPGSPVLKLNGFVAQPSPEWGAHNTSRGIADSQATATGSAGATLQTHLGNANSHPIAAPQVQDGFADSQATAAGSAGGTHHVAQVPDQTDTWPVRCPFPGCNTPMTVKSDAKDGDFLSCARYPSCRGMRRMDGTLFHEPKAIFLDSNNDAFMVTTVQEGHVLRMYRCKTCDNFSVRAVDSGPKAVYDKCEVLRCAAEWRSPRPTASVPTQQRH